MISSNKDIVFGFYSEIMNNRNVDKIGEYLTDDFTHNGDQRGLQGQTDAVNMFLNAFEGLTNTITVSLAEGDLVAIHSEWNGTHTGDFMGVAASGKKINWTSNAILKIRDGKISNAWDENDFLGLFMEIGQFPEIPNS